MQKYVQVQRLLDLSNFPVSSKYYCSDNKKVVGKTNYEYGGKSIVQFLGLKFKMYSILDEKINKKSTNKGHNASIEFQEFHNTLIKKPILRQTITGIKPENHNLGTYETNKILYHVLMINDIFSKMELIHWHMDIKTYKR